MLVQRLLGARAQTIDHLVKTRSLRSNHLAGVLLAFLQIFERTLLGEVRNPLVHCILRLGVLRFERLEQLEKSVRTRLLHLLKKRDSIFKPLTDCLLHRVQLAAEHAYTLPEVFLLGLSKARELR